MNKTDQGLVLRMKPYKESDGMAVILLKEGGLRNFVYRSYFAAKSKSLARGLPLTLIYLNYVHKAEGLLRAGQIDVLDNYTSIKNDVKRNLLGLIFCEIILFHEFSEEEASIYFDLGLSYLEQLKLTEYPEFMMVILLSSYLQIQGLAPELDEDVLGSGTKVNDFSIEHGGLVYHPGIVRTWTVEQLKKLRLLFKLNFDTLHLIEPFQIEQTLLNTIVEYFSYHTSIRLKNWEIYKQL